MGVKCSLDYLLMSKFQVESCMYQAAGKQCNFIYKIQQNISDHIGWQLIFEVLCGPFTSTTDTNLYNT